MATLTRLASTLTAKYFPSQTLTDAFYIDGRLFGKREARQADITIDKEERGFFFSVFAHHDHFVTFDPCSGLNQISYFFIPYDAAVLNAYDTVSLHCQ